MSNTVIFLDIDGVLCTLRSHYAFGDKGGLMSAWDITCCQMLRRLCEKYDCRIVISSVWRNPQNRLNTLRTYLCTYGLADYAFSPLFDSNSFFSDKVEERAKWCTPRCGHVDGKTRGTEIQAWLDENKDVEHYIIIDDDQDMLEHQKPFLILTDGCDGFSANNYEEMDKLLKGWIK